MAPAVTAPRERRATPRWSNARGPATILCRIRPGHDACVVNVSSDGVLLETARRLVPGASVELHIDQEARRIVARASVLRCSVAVVRADAVMYRGALLFDRPVVLAEPRPFVQAV